MRAARADARNDATRTEVNPNRRGPTCNRETNNNGTPGLTLQF